MVMLDPLPSLFNPPRVPWPFSHCLGRLTAPVGCGRVVQRHKGGGVFVVTKGLQVGDASLTCPTFCLGGPCWS